MNIERRVRTLEARAVDKIYDELFGGKRPFCDRSDEEKDFLAIHGFFPEMASVRGRTERSFVVHGLKTTIILEPASQSVREENNTGCSLSGAGGMRCNARDENETEGAVKLQR